MTTTASIAPVGNTNDDAPFQPGEIVEFCDDRYEVIANHGRSGRVQTLGVGSTIVEPFYWVFQGAITTRVRHDQ